jgi:hypothetical protein
VSHMIPAARGKKATICHRLQAGDFIRVADSLEVSSAVATAAAPDLFAGLTADRSVGHGAVGHGAAGAEVGAAVGGAAGPMEDGVAAGVAGTTDGTSAGIAVVVRVGAAAVVVAAGVAAVVVGPLRPMSIALT